MPPRRVDVPLAQLPPDIVALIDMSITAAMGHRLAAGALWNAMADAGQREDGVTEQKILMAKLGAEEVAALEDLGALVYAIGHRADGIIRAYLTYKPMHVRKVYSRIAGGESLTQILRLPAIESLNLDRRERHWMRKALRDLQPSLEAAAHNYSALGGEIVNAYNKIKHGSAIAQRVDLISPRARLHSEWQQQVHVLTGVRKDGVVKFTSIERSAEMMESLLRVIEMCSVTWKELAAVVVRLAQLGISLEGGATPSA